MGFDAVKIRVKYATLDEDLRVVRDVRAAVGDDFTIGVDANQGWPVSLFRPNPDWDLERATAFAGGCDELGIAWLEEPLDMHDWHGMAELRRRVKTPIAARITGRRPRLSASAPWNRFMTAKPTR